MKNGEQRVIKLPTFRGGPLAFLINHDHEVILSGGSDIGKTFAGCTKAYLLCSDKRRPNVHGCMVRKTFNSIEQSAARTFKTITQGMPIRRLGGSSYTEKWIFPNGSELITVGLDRPDRLLSSEWDFIQVVQSEQLTESDWEIIASRCTGRGATVAYPQVFGDCNPGGTKHWIRERAKSGKLTLLNSTHKDNPALFDGAGNILPEGTKRIGLLEASLTGVRRKRLLEGLWATAEGAVYDIFDSTPGGPHVKVRRREEMKRFFLAMDEGYTNPAVILVIGEDSDGRRHCFREFYQREVLQSDLVGRAHGWFTEFHCELAVVDEAAAGLIADMRAAGIETRSGKGRVLDGIQALQNRLKIAGDGNARYTVDPSCEHHIEEFESYRWAEGKDVPIKEFDHCFVGATPVLTERGMLPISNIKVGDRVWSPWGWNRVWKAGASGIRAVTDYGAFISTPDHKILTTRGLIKVDAVRYFDKLFVWQQNRPWNLMEWFTGVIRTPTRHLTKFIIAALLQKSLEAARDTCTEMYGNTIMGRFLLAWKCITRTAILRTIALSIWSLLPIVHMPENISGDIIRAWKSIWKRFDRSQKNGTHRIKGAQNTEGLVDCLGQTSKAQYASVIPADGTIRRSFLQEAGSVILTAKCERCENEETQSLKTTGHTDTEILAQTFNISTEFGCFFANGILVSNSLDAARYLEDAIGIGSDNTSRVAAAESGRGERMRTVDDWGGRTSGGMGEGSGRSVMI